MAPGYIFERGRAGGTSQGIAVIARDGRHRVILTSEIKNRDFPGQAWDFSDTKGRARLAWRGRFIRSLNGRVSARCSPAVWNSGDSKKREAGSPLVFAISVALCLNNDAINVC